MADTKISALTAATTPLAGTEVLPIVQSGVTKQVSVANLTAGRAVSAASLTLTTALTTANGGTGLTGFIANTVPYASSTSALSASGNLRYNGTSLGVGSTDYGNAGTINVAVGVVGTTTGGLQLWSTTTGTHYIQFGDGLVGDQTYRGYVAYNHNTDTLELGAAGATKATVTSAGNLSISNGNLIPATAAKGINFTANTAAAGMTSQLLNWYEEGTWTPTDNSGAGLTFDIRYAKYTRVGRAVHIVVYMVWPVTTNTANAALAGLPFTNVTNGFASLSVSSGCGTAIGAQVNSAATTITLFTAANYNTGVTNATLSNGGVEFAGTYFIS